MSKKIRAFFCTFIIGFTSLFSDCSEDICLSQYIPCPNWLKDITIGGLINVAAFGSNHTPTTIGTIPKRLGSPSATDLIVPYSNLHATGYIGDWITARLVFAYAQRSPSFVRNPAGGGDVFFAEFAELIFANPKVTHFYGQAGRHYLIFGGLDPSTYNESLTQLLSLSRHTTATIGFKDYYGLSSAFYIFKSLESRRDFFRDTTRVRNYGVALDYTTGVYEDNTGLLFGAGYISNIAGSLFISSTTSHGSDLFKGYFRHPVPAVDLHAKFNYRRFDFFANYIGATRSFNVHDVAFTKNRGRRFIGAKPAAFGINSGVSFKICDYDTRFGLGFQGSKECAAIGTAVGSVASPISGVYGPFFAIGIPEYRYYANYVIHLYPNFDIAFEVLKDYGYKRFNGGTGRNATIGMINLMAKFGAD